VAHVEHMVPGFEFEHLPERPRAVAKAFWALARRIVHGDRCCSETGISTFGEKIPDNPEKRACLNMLLAARCAALYALALEGERDR
jgi:hypothetical protein